MIFCTTIFKSSLTIKDKYEVWLICAEVLKTNWQNLSAFLYFLSWVMIIDGRPIFRWAQWKRSKLLYKLLHRVFQCPFALLVFQHQSDTRYSFHKEIKVVNTCRCEGAPYNSILGVNKLFHVQGVCWYPWEGRAKLDKILEVMVISYSNMKNSLNENLLRWPNFQLSSCFCFYASQHCPSASKVELVFFWLQKLKLCFGQKFLKVWTTCDLVWSLQM